MQIHDLTQGKYSKILDSFLGIRLDEYIINAVNSREFFNRNFLFNRYYPGTMSQKLRCFLQEVPVFLVETSMSQKTMNIPGTNVRISIPADSGVNNNIDNEDFDDFFRKLMKNSMEEDQKENGRHKKDSHRGFAIYDYLGVYVSTPNDLAPSRIFVWVDKVCNSALHNQENSQALLEQIILHEYAHALLDVTLYGYNHTGRLHYSDYPYKYIEEACANAISLWCGFYSWSTVQQAFIESFVKNQPKEYAAGWDLYDSRIGGCSKVFEFWMQAKVNLNNKVLEVLDRFWNRKDFEYLASRLDEFFLFNHDDIMLIKPRGKEIWSYKEICSGELLGLMRIANVPSVICAPKYNYIWSFDSNNLCMVMLDKPEGYRYGYINTDGIEQIAVKYGDVSGFENGLTVAKLNGYYGIINEQDEVVVPFDLDYPDMRELRNGYATMKDDYGKWGAINAQGQVVIPCEYDSLVIFDEKGIARVKKNGKEFLIDTQKQIVG